MSMPTSVGRSQKPLGSLHLVTMFLQFRSSVRTEREKKKGEIKSAEMITGGQQRHKYPLLLIERSIKRWEWKIYKYYITNATID